MKRNLIINLIIIVVVLGVIGAAMGGALDHLYPVQVSTIAGLTRNYFISWSAPPGTTTTELNPDYKSAAAAAPSPSATAPSPNATAGDWPSYNRTLTSERYSGAQPDQYEECRQAEGLVHIRCRPVRRIRVRSDHGERRSDRHDPIRYFLARPSDLRGELANARGLSTRSSAGQSRRRLYGRHAVSRHPGRAGAGL